VKLLKLILPPLPGEMSGKTTTALVFALDATINAVRKTHNRVWYIGRASEGGTDERFFISVVMTLF
jgi:hypothetical protein